MIKKKITIVIEVSDQFDTWEETERENYVRDCILCDLEDFKILKVEAAE